MAEDRAHPAICVIRIPFTKMVVASFRAMDGFSATISLDVASITWTLPMRVSDNMTPCDDPRDACVDAEVKAPPERLDQERLRAWRTNCRHHEEDSLVDETE